MDLVFLICPKMDIADLKLKFKELTLKKKYFMNKTFRLEHLWSSAAFRGSSLYRTHYFRIKASW